MTLPLVALTRPATDRLTRELAAATEGRFRVKGAPVTRQQLCAGEPAATRGLLDSGRYRWVIVSSPAAARVLAQTGPCPEGARVAAVGEGTARVLAEADWPAALTGPGSAAGLVEAFSPAPDEGARVLLPCSSRAKDTLARGLTAAGWTVDRVDLYGTVALPDLPDCYRRADVVVATAGSMVAAVYSHGVWEGAPGPHLVTIGRPSQQAAAAHGLTAIAAATPDAAGLAAALDSLPDPYRRSPA